MNWLQRIFQGRNGGDHLSLALLIISFILSILSGVFKFQLLNYLSYIPLGLGLYRMFSKDIAKRSLENYKFMMMISPVYKKYRNVLIYFQGRKTYKYFKCPNCKQRLRVPKGKGKINITCTKCKDQFIKNT